MRPHEDFLPHLETSVWSRSNCTRLFGQDLTLDTLCSQQTETFEDQFGISEPPTAYSRSIEAKSSRLRTSMQNAWMVNFCTNFRYIALKYRYYLLLYTIYIYHIRLGVGEDLHQPLFRDHALAVRIDGSKDPDAHGKTQRLIDKKVVEKQPKCR